jgi:succinate dehydrogenase/fumarate reductase cytochrome b subunit
MKRLHYISGVTITVFIGLHLLNHFLSVFGEEVHIKFMDQLRVVYRNVFIESILFVTVLIQIISGLKLFISKRKSLVTYFDKLQVWTGLYLAFFLLIHVSAVLSGRYLLSLDTNFYFGVAGLNTSPFNLFFFPYYGLAIISFFGHIAAVHYQKMKKNFIGLSVKQQSKIIFFIGIVFTVITFYGLTNGFSGVKIPEEYNVLIGK